AAFPPGSAGPRHPPLPPTALALAVVGSSRERPSHPDRVRLRCPKSFAPSDFSGRTSWWDTSGRTLGYVLVVGQSYSYIRSFVSHPLYFSISVFQYVTEPGDSCGEINPFLPTRRRSTVDHSLVLRGAQGHPLQACLPDGHPAQ